MIRVRCYYRYSSDEQIDSWSIEAQNQSCRRFIAAHPDWVLDAKPYVDEVWSGKTVHRPAFQQMLADARAGQFEVLVCHKLDRFSRTLADVLLTLDELQRCNVIFASANEAIDFTTPEGRHALVMFATFAECIWRISKPRPCAASWPASKPVIGTAISVLATAKRKPVRKLRTVRSRNCINRCRMPMPHLC